MSRSRPRRSRAISAALDAYDDPIGARRAQRHDDADRVGSPRARRRGTAFSRRKPAWQAAHIDEDFEIERWGVGRRSDGPARGPLTRVRGRGDGAAACPRGLARLAFWTEPARPTSRPQTGRSSGRFGFSWPAGRFAAKASDRRYWIRLDFLGFSRRKRDLSMGYAANKPSTEFSRPFFPLEFAARPEAPTVEAVPRGRTELLIGASLTGFLIFCNELSCGSFAFGRLNPTQLVQLGR